MVNAYQLFNSFKRSWCTLGRSFYRVPNCHSFSRTFIRKLSELGQRGLVFTFSPCVYPYPLLIHLTLHKKQEPLPTLKAAARLLTHIFSVAIDIPEFQRQVASPNVPKFSLALVQFAEDHPSRELKVSQCNTLP